MKYENDINRRKAITRNLMFTSMGGKCSICLYDTCTQALEFHHLDPNEKDFTISYIWKSNSWNKIVNELRKCIMVCGCCHREIHAGITQIPTDVTRFNEQYAVYDYEPECEEDRCPVCSKSVRYGKYCSMSCSSKHTYIQTKILKYTDEQIYELYLRHGKYTVVGKIIGLCADQTSTRIKKYKEANNIPIHSSIGNTKLTPQNVIDIKEMLKAGKSTTEISKHFSVNRRTIYDIREGRSHVT